MILMTTANTEEKTVLDISSLTKCYGKATVVDNVSISVKKGHICGLIGPNGAGKTTIMKMLGGLVIPTGGEISIFGGSSEAELAKARSRMSFIIETPYAKEGMSARENLEKQRLQKGIPDKKRIDEVLETVGLSDAGKKPVKNFSLGMRQRLGIANALLTKPEIMVLDEPVNGLDPEGIVQIRELLMKLNRDEHITILISSHILSELSLMCTDYIFINGGKLIREVSSETLKKECSEFYRIDTDNNSLAAAILHEKLGITEFDVDRDGSIRLFEGLNDMHRISKSLYENGVVPTVLSLNEANLEQYYLNLINAEDEQNG